MTIQERLFALSDEKYAQFQHKLAPTIPLEACIGVRVPDVRKIAKELKGTSEAEQFLAELPHQYYDENMLHSFLINDIKDYVACMAALEAYLPYVDNWAACDSLCPKVFKKHKPELLEKVRVWAKSEHEFTCRFALVAIMNYFLEDDFDPSLFEITTAIHSEDYYVKMALAWLYSVALVKQYEAAIKIIENNVLDTWVHNKSIQKARESYRISDDRKDYLKSLKR